MGNAYRRSGPPAVVMFLLLAGCAATGPPAVGPELEPIVVEAQPLDAALQAAGCFNRNLHGNLSSKEGSSELCQGRRATGVSR